MKLLATTVFACLLVGPAAARAGDKESKQQKKLNLQHASDIASAQKAAEAWLKIEDSARYAEAWKAASQLFQSNVPEAAWDRRMQAVRRPLDPVLTRTLDVSEYKTQLPNLPTGEYVAFVWETVFGSGRPSLESLVMTDEKGQWKMAGYAVQ